MKSESKNLPNSNILGDCCFEIVKNSQSVILATENFAEKQKWQREFNKARQALLSPQNEQIPSLSLFCMGTVRITLIGGHSLGVDATMPYVILELNDQRVELTPKPGPNPIWNQSEVLCQSSYDDILRVSVFNFHKYAPNPLIGLTDLSLNFLEYYNERSTDQIELCLSHGSSTKAKGKISLILQFRSL